MEEHLKYPFRLKSVLFSKVEVNRQPKIPEPLELNMAIRLELHVDKLPEEFQLTIKVHTVGEHSVSLAVHLVGIFETEGEERSANRELIADFVNDRGFYILFPILRHQIYQLTASMGIRPVELPMPLEVEFPLGELDVEKEGKVRF